MDEVTETLKLDNIYIYIYFMWGNVYLVGLATLMLNLQL